MAVKEVSYDVPALIITPEKPVPIEGNFERVEKTLEKWALRISKMSLTENNLSEVQSIKKAAVAVRNQLDAKVEAAKRLLFNDPKKIFEARMKPLFTLIEQVEEKTDEVLDKIEQERCDAVNEVLDRYKGKFQEQYKLDEGYLSRIDYRKNYYNKGMEEKSRKDDLEAQFKKLKKEQDAHAANVRLINVACKNEPRLNIERYVRDLAQLDVATIIEEIEVEKVRLKELDSPAEQTTTTSSAVEVSAEVVEPKKVILGVPNTIDFKSDFPAVTKTMVLQLTYPIDLGDALTKLFESLSQYGIKKKLISVKPSVLQEEAVW